MVEQFYRQSRESRNIGWRHVVRADGNVVQVPPHFILKEGWRLACADDLKPTAVEVAPVEVVLAEAPAE